MNKYFGFGNELKQVHKLVELLKNPITFFSKNKDKKEDLLNFYTFMLRLGAVVEFPLVVFVEGSSMMRAIVGLVVVLLLAKIIAIVWLWIGSFFRDLFVKLFASKSDIVAARRVVTFSAISAIIPTFDIFSSLFAMLVSFYFITIGTSKQYKLSYGRALWTVVGPWLVIGLVVIFIMYLAVGNEIFSYLSFL